jgi:DNA-binding IclR family transcriptional regulator
MRRISDTYGQTVLLTKLVGDAILCTEQEEPASQFVRLSYRRGKQMAVNAGASALVCIAWLDEPALHGLLERRPLEQISPGTIAEREPLLTRLAKIREDGYVVTRGEVDPEGMGIAVPIFDSTGDNVLAGLSVVALQSRIAREEVRSIVDDLLTASASITAGLLSYRG